MGQDPEHDLIEEYLDHLRERNRARRTIISRREMLYRHHRELCAQQIQRGQPPHGLDKVSEDDLRATIYRYDPVRDAAGNIIRAGWSPKTVAANHAGLTSYYRYAVRRGHLNFDPTANLPR